MSRRTVAVGLLLTLLAIVSACTSSQEYAESGDRARTIRVLAASDLKFALDEIVHTFEQTHPDIEVSVSYGSSGTFLQQIQNGAPADLFLSADHAYPQQLVAEGLAQMEDLFAYAVGRLVLWVPEDSAIDPAQGLSVLAEREVRTVAIANPEHAPYGKAAVAALRSAGLADRVSRKLVLGENISQAAEFVQSGSADAGIVAKSLVLADTNVGVGEWWELPLELYPRLDQGGVVLRHDDRHPARLLREAIVSPEGLAVMERYGFTPPEA